MIERAPPRLVLGALALLVVACRPDPEACCRVDDDCAAGAACFEGLCAPRCNHDSQCPEQELCSAAGVCVALGRPKSHCAFAFDPIGPGGPADAGAGEGDGGGPVDAGPPEGVCAPDRHEPNDTAAAATSDVAPVESLTLCAGDEDFFAIGVGAGEVIAARIEFLHARGDLDMELLFQGAQVAVSQGVSDVEEIQHAASAPGTYVLHVYGFGGAANRYDLALARVPGPVGCVDDDLEENDNADEARPLRIGQGVSPRLCPTDGADFFTLELPPQLQTRVTLTYNAPPGLRLGVSTSERGTLTSESGGGSESVVLLQEFGGTALIEVSGEVPLEEGRGYRLRAVVDDDICQDPTEPNDSPATATDLVPPGTPDLAICPGDLDFFRIRDPEGRDVLNVRLRGDDLVEVRGSIVRESDATVLAQLAAGDTVALDLREEAPGDLLLVVTTDEIAAGVYWIDLF